MEVQFRRSRAALSAALSLLSIFRTPWLTLVNYWLKTKGMNSSRRIWIPIPTEAVVAANTMTLRYLNGIFERE